MFKRIIYFVLLLLLFPFIYFFIIDAYNYILINIINSDLIYFAYGFAGYGFLYFLFLKKKISFIETFEHELSHTITALLFFKRVYSFNASEKQGGQVSSCSTNFFITLAPYFLPLLTIPFLVIKPFMFSETYFIIDIFIGITYSFHLFALFNEFSFSQSDIKKCGYIFSTVIIFIFNLFFFILILNSILNNHSAILTFFSNVYSKSIDLYVSLYYNVYIH